MMDYEGPESTNSSEQGKGKDTGRSLLLDEYSRAHRQMFHEQDGYPNQGQVGRSDRQWNVQPGAA